MDRRQTIFIMAFLAVTFGNPKTEKRKMIDNKYDTNINQLINRRRMIHKDVNTPEECIKEFEGRQFDMKWTIIDALKHVLEKLTMPQDLSTCNYTNGAVYKYQMHLYTACILLIGKVVDPKSWCKQYPKKKQDACISNMKLPDIEDPTVGDIFEYALKFCNYYFRERNNKFEVICLKSFISIYLSKYISYMGDILKSEMQKTTALPPNEFCNNIQNPPTPVIRETDPGNTSNSQSNVDETRVKPSVEDVISYIYNASTPDLLGQDHINLPDAETAENDKDWLNFFDNN